MVSKPCLSINCIRMRTFSSKQRNFFTFSTMAQVIPMTYLTVSQCPSLVRHIKITALMLTSPLGETRGSAPLMLKIVKIKMRETKEYIIIIRISKKMRRL